MLIFYKRTFLYWFFTFLLSGFTSFSQVVINEICPTNISIIQNSNGKYDDWIELHNAGASTVNLAGYGLSDDTTKLFRFSFPSYNLLPGKKILVFTSDSTNELIADHWEMAINAVTSWRYAAGSSSIDTNWRNQSFNQNLWSSGNGGIGFGDGDDNTTIAVGASVMMRKTFNIPDTSQILKAVLMMDYDDGFIAYLNGVEIARANITTAGARPLWNDLANSSHEALIYRGLQPDSFYISPSLFKSLLRPTNNVLAIETHNTPANSDDLSSIPYLFFGMKSSGSTFSAIPSWFHVPVKDYFNAHFKLNRYGETIYLTNPSATIIDQETYPSMQNNNSYCRKPDGSLTWCFVSTPTPDASNNSSTCYNGYAYAPVFSIQGGYYNTTKTLILSTATPGGVIRYTKNGDIPNTSDPVYSSPITISSSSSVRAKVFASGYLPSQTVTNTYIINESTHLPMISITTDSLNLWDYNTGIYVMGPNADTTYPFKNANFWQNWEKPASIEYYDRNKNLIVRFDGDIKLYGNYSRTKPQKSFEIKLSSKNGTGSFTYPMYSDKQYVDNISNIVLRNSGTDWNVVHFRDALMERILKTTNTGYLASEPAIAYLNGSYWGVYCINENHDHHWMKNNFGLGKSEIDYLKEFGPNIQIQEGSDATFWDLYNYATVQSPATQSYYNYINSLLDLKNYSDYFVAETYYNNGDWIGEWTNNLQMWRPNAPGSKWRYFVYDLDFGLGYAGSVYDNRLAIARNPTAFSYSSVMFNAILNNPTFKRYFINRYADLINTIFLPSNVNAMMHSFKDTMAFDMNNHFAKWGSNNTTWNTNITIMMNFANARPNIMRDYIDTIFSLSGKVALTLATSPPGSGRIEISTITPTTYPWTGIYFNGNPVTITAIPNPGYTFDHFRSNVTIASNNYNQSVTYNFTANDQITAYFTGSASAAKLCVSELNYNSDSAYNAGDWIELHNYGTTSLNLSGWKLSDGSDNHLFLFPTGTVIAPNGYLVITEDSVKFKSQFPSVNNRIGPLGFNFSNSGDQIRLFNHLNTVYLSFYYQDLAPWPVPADGGGYTCELYSNQADPNNGNNWFTGCIGGSPGRLYSPLLAIPVTISGSTTFCLGGSVQLNATYVSGYSYQWNRNGLDIPGETDSILTVTQSGSYSVKVTYLGCSIVSTAATITVVTQQPAPQTVSTSRCGAGVLTLLASSSDSVFWYDASIGGNLIGSGDTLFTPALSQTTTYYARTGRGCQSNSIATIASITPLAQVPVSNDVTRCGPGTVTLNATDTAAIRWYNYPLGGGLLGTDSSFTTNILNNDTSFYIEAGSVCPSQRVEVHVTVNTTPVPIVTDASRCGSGTLVLTADSPAPISWFSSQNGGSSIDSGSTFTTPLLAVTDTFYAEANSGCPSVRVRGIAIINSEPANPVVSDVTICNPGTVTFNASASEQVNWYDSLSGGSLLYTGSNFTTPFLSSTITYYADAGYVCQSSRVAAQAIVSSTPSAPSASDVSRCGPGNVTLNASSPESISWYNAPTGGTLLATNNTFITPVIPATTTYYAEAGTYCRSHSRTPVMAIINPIPAPPSASNVIRCSIGSVMLTATAPQQISWYGSSSGGAPLATGTSFTTPSISTTTTYYLEDGNICTSNRISVQAIVSQQLAAPGITNASRCGSGTVTLIATSPATVSWFNTSSGGNVLGTGLSFTTPIISTTTTYYAEANNGCISTRSSVQAIVNSVPSPPTTSNVSRCGSGSVTLTATSPQTIYWFTAASGGSSVGTGISYATPSLLTSTTYYVETGNNCRSARIPVQAIINTIPPTPSLLNVSHCGPGIIILTASSPSQVRWFNIASGGTSLGAGLTFTTPALNSTTTYYAQATDSGCNSTRVSVQAIINIIPAIPGVSNNSRCGTGTVNLTASGVGQLYWYSSASGGNPLDSGTTFTTPVINSTTNFYVEVSNGNCRSNRISIQAIVNPVPAAPVANDVSRCGNGQITLTASAPQQIYWYSSASGGNLLSTGTTFTTPSLTTSTAFYVETGNLCRSARVLVNAQIVSKPDTPVLFDTSRCGNGVVVIRASSVLQVNWYNVQSGGALLDTGLFFTTPFINVSTTYYAEAGLGCNSVRVPVQANVNFPPAAPNAADSIRCGPGFMTLSASSSENLYWYNSATGGNLLGTGSVFTTPSITFTTTYYVEAGNNCRSSRIPVLAIIGGSQVSSVTEGSNCGPGQVTLYAVAPQPADTLLWYDYPGGQIIGTGATFITPYILSNTTFYVVAVSVCTGAPYAVAAHIFPLPVVNLGQDTITIQSGQTVTLIAGPGFVSYLWSTSETTSDIEVNTQGLYSVQAKDINDCIAYDEIFVSIITSVNPVFGNAILQVYPNPTHEQLTIKIKELSSKNLLLKLFSADGKIILREEIKSVNGQFTKILSLSGIVAGVYFLEIENNEYSARVKVLVE